MAIVFAFSDYKKFVKARIEKSDKPWGLISKLAEAAGCQRSYLSRVLNEEIHLTPDHAYGLSQFWNLNSKETDYFLLLVEKDRAASLGYRNNIQEKLKSLKDEYDDLQNRVQRPKANFVEQQLLYYSTWYYSALHIAVSISKLQTAKALSEKFEIPIDLVNHGLLMLKTMGLIRNENGKWTFNESEIHVAKDSPLVNLHHNNWRQRALLDAQKGTKESVHFTVVQSLDEQAFERVKGGLLQFIEEATKIATPSKSEKLICLGCDFFEV